VTVKKGSKPPKFFSNLQQAVDAAPNGATLTVTGRCEGPVFVTKRSSLTIQGVTPAQTRSGCPDGGLESGDLTSTVVGTVDHLIKLTNSSGIRVQFLNLVDGPSSGLEVRDSSKVTAFCNCIARNDEGVELHAATSSVVLQNLVEENVTAGIRLNRSTKTAKKNQVTDNVVRNNGQDGILLSEESTQNTVQKNDVFGNGDDGIELNDSDKNKVTDNTVTSNVDAGVLIEESDKNVINNNIILGNGDALVNQASCVTGDGNTGNNVPPACQ
jgi:parallel beta-helix repeat protein